MRFQIIDYHSNIDNDIALIIRFKSSKEDWLIGKLVFRDLDGDDSDGDERPDVKQLFWLLMKQLNSPLIELVDHGGKNAI